MQKPMKTLCLTPVPWPFPHVFSQVDGLGTVGRSAPGSYGPEAGSIVEASHLAKRLGVQPMDLCLMMVINI
jgi:hypothetical protein